MPGPIDWQVATVVGVRDETPSVRSLSLSLPAWPGHRPGQHVDLRLTAEDGYSVERSYSIASEPEAGSRVEITVERIAEGEVSPFLHDVVVPGDGLEVRGPIGGYFVWEAALGGPLLLIAGGSGIVPLMAMLRHRARAGPSVAAVLLDSVRRPEDVIYAEELARLASSGDGLPGDGLPGDGLHVVHTFTRGGPPGWTGYTRRIDERMLVEVLEPLGAPAWTYVCGPTAFVEVAADALVRTGLPADRVRTERFGPSGT